MDIKIGRWSKFHSVAMIKYPEKNKQVRKDEFILVYSFKLQSIIVEVTEWYELEINNWSLCLHGQET